MIFTKALEGRKRWQQYVGLLLLMLLLNSANVYVWVCHRWGCQNIYGEQPWNLDCIRFSFHLMECQTALTWITYAKCGAIHMVSGAGYVWFFFCFSVWIYGYLCSKDMKSNNCFHWKQREREKLMGCFVCSIFIFIAGDTKNSDGVLLRVSPLLPGSNITQATTDT